MSTIKNFPFNRPTSVMSLLADQMQSSCINEIPCTVSPSASIHRYSVPNTCFNCFDPQSDATMNSETFISNESDISSPQLPSKRLCHSSSNDGIARPIPIKVDIKSYFNNINDASNNFPGCTKQNRMSYPKTTMTIKTPQRNLSNLSIRPIISPHYKKSAFTPTRSQVSPQTTSSDYSISPEIESPIHRSASVTSSGFHDCSQQSLLIDPNYSPDSNQRSKRVSITNTEVTDTHHCLFPRCHSQPCDVTVLKIFMNRSAIIGANKVCTYHNPSTKYTSQVHTPMKRRYPSLSHIRSNSQSDNSSVQNVDSPTNNQCYKHIPNSADTSPNACGTQSAMYKRDSYFFGSGRSYLISLPRIASSPPPVSLQADPPNIVPGHRQRIGSNSSSLSTSTTTDTNTPTVIFNGVLQQKIASDSIICNKGSAEDVDMDNSLHENRSTMTLKSDNYHCYDTFDCSVVAENQSVMWSDLNCATVNSRHNGCHHLCTTASLSQSSCSVSGISDLTTTTSSKSYSTNSDSTSHCNNISHIIDSELIRSELRDPGDPPDIGVCFSQLSNDQSDSMMTTYEDHSSSFQELDLDQIELD